MYTEIQMTEIVTVQIEKPHMPMKMKELQYLISIWLNPKNRFKIYKKRWYDLNEAFT